MDANKLARYFDHTLLKPEAKSADVQRLCHEALHWGFATVCVNPSMVKLSSDLLVGTPVRVCTVIGFPLGAVSTSTKIHEARQAVLDGAQELDMVINLGWVADQAWSKVEAEIRDVIAECSGYPVKVILETCYWDKPTIVDLCRLSESAGASFVKTSTGFGPAGALLEQVAWMRHSVSDHIGVKASGGIRTLDQAQGFLEIGANRIGASATVAILEEFIARKAQNPLVK